MGRIAAALLAVTLTGCAGVQEMLGAAFERPRIAYESFTPEQADLEGVTLKLRFRVENPNPIGIKVATADYQLDVEGSQVVTGSTRSGLGVPARGKASLDLPVRLRYADVPRLLTTLVSKDEITFTFHGGAGLDTPVGVIQLPFSCTGRLPTPKLPGLTIVGAAIKSIGPDGVAFDLKLEVQNRNAFPLPAGALAYGLQVGGRQVLADAAHALSAVPAHGKSTVVIPVRLPFAAAAEAAGKLLRGGATDLTLKGKASYGPLQQPVDLDGKLGR